MIEMLRAMLFEPRYPHGYVGRHRMPHSLPMITITLRRPRDFSA